MKDIKILIIMHKPYKVPEDNKLYLPIQSGAAISNLDLHILKDNTGDNISEKNPQYNELCPMYWAWKNLQTEYIGISQYRRLFSDDRRNTKHIEDILTRETIETLLDKYEVIVPHKRNYYFQSIENHYVNSLASQKEAQKKDIIALRRAILEISPEYSAAFEHVMASKSCHMFHMCIMKKSSYDDFCSFMYPVIFRADQLIVGRKDTTRYIGAISEFLLDVWMYKNQIKYYELGLVELEKMPLFKRVIFTIKRNWFK